MKKLLLMVTIFSSIIFAKEETNKEMKDVKPETSIEKEEKIQSYINQKDSAWHRNEYNKVLKYLMKNKK